MRFRLMMPTNTGESSGMRFLRFVLVIGVFAGVAQLYSCHFDNTLEEIRAKTGVLDKSGLLDRDFKDNVREMADFFEDDFGLDLRVLVNQGPVDKPEITPKMLFVGLDVQSQTLEVIAPVVWERAIGREFFDTLESEHMLPYFVAQDWPNGLLQALVSIWRQMAAIENRDSAGNIDE